MKTRHRSVGEIRSCALPRGATVALALMLVSGLASGQTGGDPIAGALQIGADNSLREPIQDAAEAFSQAGGGEPVVLHLAPSGLLRRKIESGEARELDVFIGTTPGELEALSQHDLIVPDTVRVLAANELVIASAWPGPADRPWQSLARFDWDRIGIASDQTSMSGVGARQTFEQNGLTEVINPRVFTFRDSDQLVEALKRAQVDAGIIYQSDIPRLRPADTFRIFPLAPTNFPEIVISAVVMRASPRVPEARAFIEFLASTNLASFWERRGFTRPEVARKPRLEPGALEVLDARP